MNIYSDKSITFVNHMWFVLLPNIHFPRKHILILFIWIDFLWSLLILCGYYILIMLQSPRFQD